MYLFTEFKVKKSSQKHKTEKAKQLLEHTEDFHYVVP